MRERERERQEREREREEERKRGREREGERERERERGRERSDRCMFLIQQQQQFSLLNKQLVEMVSQNTYKVKAIAAWYLYKNTYKVI